MRCISICQIESISNAWLDSSQSDCHSSGRLTCGCECVVASRKILRFVVIHRVIFGELRADLVVVCLISAAYCIKYIELRTCMHPNLRFECASASRNTIGKLRNEANVDGERDQLNGLNTFNKC